MKILRRSQTTARQGLGVLRLPVSENHFADAGKMVISPYFQTQDTRRIGTGRDTITILDMIKAFYLGYTALSTSMRVSVFTIDDSDSSTAVFSIPLTVAASDTHDTINAMVPSTVTAYLFAHAGFTPDTTEWLFTPPGMSNRSESSVSLSVQTSTGAVGTQISTNQDALVMVDLSTTTTANISGNAAIDLVLEAAPTNSATPGDWVTKGRTGNAQALTLAITLQSVQTNKSQTVAYVPAGYYVKVRSTGATGTTSSAVVEARVVLL